MQMRRNARRKCEICHEKNNFSIAIRFPSAFGICLASFVGFVQGSCVEVLCLELCSAKSEFELVGIYHGIYMEFMYSLLEVGIYQHQTGAIDYRHKTQDTRHNAKKL